MEQIESKISPCYGVLMDRKITGTRSPKEFNLEDKCIAFYMDNYDHSQHKQPIVSRQAHCDPRK